eukprot:s4323_g12.t1
MAPMQGFPSILKEINPDAARLAELVKKPGRRAPAEPVGVPLKSFFDGLELSRSLCVFWKLIVAMVEVN